MKAVNIEIPASLFCGIYKIYGDDTGSQIIKALQSLEDKADEGYVWKSLRPGTGTITGRVWEIADEYKKMNGGMVSRESIVKKCIEEGINMNTANTQFSHWIKEQL